MRGLAALLLVPVLVLAQQPLPASRAGAPWRAPPRPAPAPPPPRPAGPLPRPPPLDEDALWREVDRLVALEESADSGAPFNLTDYKGELVATPRAKRCVRAVRTALHQQRLGIGPRLYADKMAGVQVGPKDAPEDPRLVYFLMLSRPTAHLTVSRLLHAVHHPSHLFLLHLDLKMNETAAEAVRAYAEPLSNVHLMRRRRLVQWGAFTMVATMLDAMRSVVEFGLQYDFFINLSDTDLALRTNAEILDWLRPFGAASYSMLAVHSGDSELMTRTLKFASEHPVVECTGFGFVAVTGKVFDLTPKPYCCFGRSGPVFYKKLDAYVPPSLPTPSTFSSGSQWAILHRDLVNFTVRDPVAKQWARVFERRVLPDEMFLQTVLEASPFNRSVFKHNLRWIDWPHYHGDPGAYWATVGWSSVGGPRVLRADDAPDVFASPFFFARKAEPQFDSDLLRRWDVWMGDKLRGLPDPHQLPIAEDIVAHDPGLRSRAGAAPPALNGSLPRAVLDASALRSELVVALEFADGSSCRCADPCPDEGACCEALFPGVCSSLYADAANQTTDEPASDNATLPLATAPGTPAARLAASSSGSAATV